MSAADDDERIERRGELAAQLIWANDWLEMDYMAPYAPSRLLPDLRAATKGLDAAEPNRAADKLVLCLRLLLQLSLELRYPRWAEGYGSASYYSDACEDLVSNQNDDALLLRSKRHICGDIRRRVDALDELVQVVEDDFRRVVHGGHRRVANADKIAAADGPIGDLAVFLALFAVELDPNVAERSSRD